MGISNQTTYRPTHKSPDTCNIPQFRNSSPWMFFSQFFGASLSSPSSATSPDDLSGSQDSLIPCGVRAFSSGSLPSRITSLCHSSSLNTHLISNLSPKLPLLLHLCHLLSSIIYLHLVCWDTVCIEDTKQRKISSCGLVAHLEPYFVMFRLKSNTLCIFTTH